MGRRPTINREALLDHAEEIVRADGPQALTIDALAKAARISKGGVQYSFASKDDLVKALVDRWTAQFDAQLELDRPTPPIEFVRRYIATLRSAHSAVDAKMAGLMIAYMQNPQNQRETRDWYRSIFDRLSPATSEAQTARVAFLALEGVFLMKLTGDDRPEIEVSLLDDVEAILDRLQPPDRSHWKPPG